MVVTGWIVGGLVVSALITLAAAQVCHFNQKPRRPDLAPWKPKGWGGQ